MNDYDSILARLKADMPSDISVIEGSMLGDMLCAVANELARFYDMEISEIYDKAFVSTASGDYLTNACLDYGIERQEGETDELLRERALYRIKNQASSGNEAHYREWVKSFSDVMSVQIGKTAGGIINVYVVSDRTDEQLIGDIAAYIEEHRPIGASVNVSYAAQRVMPVHVDLTMMSGFTAEAVKEDVRAVFNDFFARLKAEDGAAFIGFTAIKNMILGIDGVSDITYLSIDSQKASFSLNTGEYPALGNFSVG